MSPGLKAVAEAALAHGWCEATITADMGREILGGSVPAGPEPNSQALAEVLLNSNRAELFLKGSGNRGLPHKLTGREAGALARWLITQGVRVD